MLPPVVPPFNFASVEEDFYRGAYPTLKNFRFLRRLRLATIISLTPEEPNADLAEFCRAESIVSRHVAVEKHGESVACTAATIAKVLKVVCARSSHPVYLHCLDGTNNTALVVACLRKLQNWAPVGWLAEFARFSRDASVGAEEAFAVEQFKDEIKLTASQLPRWLWGGRRIAKHASIRIVYRDEREKESRLAAKAAAAAVAASGGGSQEPPDAASALPPLRSSLSFPAIDAAIAMDVAPAAASVVGPTPPQSSGGANADDGAGRPSSPPLLNQPQPQRPDSRETAESPSESASRPPHGQRRRTSSIVADDIEFDDDAADYDADPLEVAPVVYAPMPWEVGSSTASHVAGAKRSGGGGERIAATLYDLLAAGGENQTQSIPSTLSRLVHSLALEDITMPPIDSVLP